MIKLLVFDVDGTLSDGKVYFSQSGEEIKSFDIRDGLAINESYPKTPECDYHRKGI